MSFEIDSDAIAAGSGLQDCLFCLRKFLDSRACESFFQLRPTQFQIRLGSIKCSVGSVQQLRGSESTRMDFPDTTEFALPKFRVPGCAFNAGSRRCNLFRAWAAHQLAKSCLQLCECGVRFRQPRGGSCVVLLDQYLTGGDYLTFRDGYGADRFAGLGRQLVAVGCQFTDDAVGLVALAASCEQQGQGEHSWECLTHGHYSVHALI